jgi:hypothetical protein
MNLLLIWSAPGSVVIKKMMSPCSIGQGLWAAAQKRSYLCVHKRGNSSPLSKYRGLSVYSMNKIGGRRKICITGANAARWLTSGSVPSQSLLKHLLWYEIALWLWALTIFVVGPLLSGGITANSTRGRILERNLDKSLLSVFLIAIYSPLYRIALIFIFSQTHATSYIFLQSLY